MNKALLILLGLAITGTTLATEQEPDILIYDGLKLTLETHWIYPSPLQVYYYQKSTQYPFEMLNTGNYRGHVATWEINDRNFYLTEVTIKGIEYKPKDYNVRSTKSSSVKGNKVWADWFSGMLKCWTEGYGDYYYFHVRNGVVLNSTVLTRQDRKTIDSTSNEATLNDELRRKLQAQSLMLNYVGYYNRLSESDNINYGQKTHLLVTGPENLSPIFAFYKNEHLNWPYNWENTEKHGAPNCKWIIKDKKLYLTGIELWRGTESLDAEPLDLASLFKDKVVNGIVHADWVTGVYLLEYGHEVEDEDLPEYTTFEATELTFIRIEDGYLKESYTVPGDFTIEDASGNIDPGLKQIIKEYIHNI